MMMLKYIYFACLIVIFVHYGNTIECHGHWREMAKATDIKLPALHQYMTFLDCQSDQRDATLAVYSAECLQNTTCVGIRLDQPGAFCTLLNSPRDDGITPLDDNLWLIINELPGFAGCDAMLDYRCYKAYSDEVTWYPARDTCISEGGALVSVCNQEINDLLREIMQTLGVSRIWLGATDEADEGNWEWASEHKCRDSEPFTNWYPEEPDNREDVNGGPSQNCMVMGNWNPNALAHFEWMDAFCVANMDYPFVCEFDII